MGVAPCQVGQGKREEWGHTTVRQPQYHHSNIHNQKLRWYVPLVQEASVGEVHGFVGGLVEQEGAGSGQDHP